ncbi:MAG: hypothetical protein DMG07_08830 [Acidobacteria bacterium]|nr:MAG: hypothetical protein DMG07_08830 [Acidobacteriota bacterium]
MEPTSRLPRRWFGLLFCVVLALTGAYGQKREKMLRISYGDWVEQNESLNSKDAIERTFEKVRAAGYTHILWRLLWEGHGYDHMVVHSAELKAQHERLKARLDGTPYAWDPHEIRWPIAVAHRLGMKFYASIVPYNEGAPPERTLPKPPLGLGKNWYQSKLVYDHPEYQAVDRSGKKVQYGILEWAYPEARRHWVEDVRQLVDRYDVDGIYMDTRTESPCPEFADQFGFNEPVVREYQRRYGVDILKEEFDLEKWRALRGEYFTQLLAEMSQVIRAKGKVFHLGTSRGDYLGYPLGNLKLDWRRWMREKIVDELHVDEHGWCWGSDAQPFGFMTDFPTGRGLKPIATAIREDYGPLARQFGIRLYLSCNPYRPRPFSEPCCQHRAAPSVPPAAKNWCDGLRGMTEFAGTLERQAF